MGRNQLVGVVFSPAPRGVLEVGLGIGERGGAPGIGFERRCLFGVGPWLEAPYGHHLRAVLNMKLLHLSYFLRAF